MARKARSGAALRTRLRHETREIHESLHSHPLLSRLLARDVQLVELRKALAATALALGALERARDASAAWPDLTVQPDIDRLLHDLSWDTCPQLASPAASPAFAASPHHLLGALYVSHGARFGRNVIGASLRARFPDQRLSYHDPVPPDQWEHLLASLQQVEVNDADAVVEGAEQMFTVFRQTADQMLQNPTADVAGHDIPHSPPSPIPILETPPRDATDLSDKPRNRQAMSPDQSPQRAVGAKRQGHSNGLRPRDLETLMRMRQASARPTP